MRGVYTHRERERERKREREREGMKQGNKNGLEKNIYYRHVYIYVYTYISMYIRIDQRKVLQGPGKRSLRVWVGETVEALFLKLYRAPRSSMTLTEGSTRGR